MATKTKTAQAALGDPAAKLKLAIEESDRTFEAAKQICKVLLPLSQKERVKVLHAACVLLEIPWPIQYKAVR